MPEGKIRALCAKIALEINPDKADALIAELKRLLNGDYPTAPTKVTEKLPHENIRDIRDDQSDSRTF
jgi:hypothetical protein